MYFTQFPRNDKIRRKRIIKINGTILLIYILELFFVLFLDCFVLPRFARTPRNDGGMELLRSLI